MESDTNTQTRLTDDRARPAGGLILRILAVNLIVPVVLVLGLLYMDQYKAGLMAAENEAVRVQARLFAASLAGKDTTDSETRALLERMAEITQTAVRVADSRDDPILSADFTSSAPGTERFSSHASVALTLHDGTTATLQVRRSGALVGTALDRIRFAVFGFFLSVLSITILMSVYLAGIIGTPVTRLARAAEQIRKTRSRDIAIPDLSARGDEIGALSRALRDMTQALWERMDTIEAFAADVAHELKNPLTSLRSAIETLGKLEDKADQAQLLAIMQHDVRRLDRLITDISRASRLDAALNREEKETLDLVVLLRDLCAAHAIGKPDTIMLSAPEDERFLVHGNETRLAQVFENLITNALSFSPADRPVRVVFDKEPGAVRVRVRDEGPGVPDEEKDRIFKRFYTRRPEGEAYGEHSGLGLSIAQQIVAAHGGTIMLEDKTERAKAGKGACFTVVLPAL
ncbi:MAG: HAMP domain-containing histidine kinase [Alphaproteobacteria bacterium]|nr:HAMP domain-containing histidine kinase [Alphaproteobacteria bacterium]